VVAVLIGEHAHHVDLDLRTCVSAHAGKPTGRTADRTARTPHHSTRNVAR
jgi:hypothetical protein